MCGGEEEEVKIFIDIHVHLVQVPKSSALTGLEKKIKTTKNKWALLFLRVCKKVKIKRTYCLQLSCLSSSIFTPGKRTGMA